MLEEPVTPQPVKQLTIQGYYDDQIHETPNSTSCKCWNVVRMIVVSFILGMVVGLVIHPYVMPFFKDFA